MSASIFTTLPAELICRVFEFADDFSVVAALARTARIFYDTWRENPTYICRTVASRVISNLTDAERLVDMQEAAEAVSQSQDSVEHKSIIRAKRLLFNARCASAAGDTWVSLCQNHESFDRGENPHMRPSEFARFEHAFYCVWTIGVIGRARHGLKDRTLAFLDQCSPRELYRIDELRTWAKSYSKEDFGFVGLDLDDEVWKAGYDLVVNSERWRVCPDGRHGMTTPDYTRMNFFAFFYWLHSKIS